LSVPSVVVSSLRGFIAPQAGLAGAPSQR